MEAGIGTGHKLWAAAMGIYF